MIVISCTDISVIRYAESCPELLEVLNDGVNVCLRCCALFLSLLLDLLAVFVSTGKEHYIVALHSLHSCDAVASDRRVAMSDVRIARRIVDGRSDVEWFLLVVCHNGLLIVT